MTEIKNTQKTPLYRGNNCASPNKMCRRHYKSRNKTPCLIIHVAWNYKNPLLKNFSFLFLYFFIKILVCNKSIHCYPKIEDGKQKFSNHDVWMIWMGCMPNVPCMLQWWRHGECRGYFLSDDGTAKYHSGSDVEEKQKKN